MIPAAGVIRCKACRRYIGFRDAPDEIRVRQYGREVTVRSGDAKVAISCERCGAVTTQTVGGEPAPAH